MFDVLVFVELDFPVLHIIDIIIASTLADFSYPVLGPLIYLLPDFSILFSPFDLPAPRF